MSQIAGKFIQDGAITNAKVNASAAIVYSKLALSNSIVNADIASGAAIAYSKLNLSASVLASDMNSGAATNGQVLTADGAGGASYTTISSSGANTALSNLITTSINQDLLPSATLSHDIGTASLRWNTIWSSVSNASSFSAFNGAGTLAFLTLRGIPATSPSTALSPSLYNPASDNATAQLRDISIFTETSAASNSARTGIVRIETGNKTAGTGDSGDISLVTGTSSGGARGVISLSGLSINANTSQIHNVVDPTSAQDAATKNYVDTVSGSAITSLTGDVTATGPGAAAATLATVNGNVGSFGSSTSIPSFTVNAKGLITAASGNVVIAPAGTLTGTTLNSSVVTSSLTSLGTQSVALNMGTHLINNVVNPVSAQDAATKSYVDGLIVSANYGKETIVLSGTDITNQYIDLAHVAKTNSIMFLVKGAGDLLEGASYDYSVSYTGGAGGNTRITFLNDLATGGVAALVATDVVQVNYVY